MLKLIIEDDEGRKTVVPFMRDEITIGRQEGNTIRLTERNVSRRHARLLRQNGHVLVEDLGSYNGVRINGERIQGPAQVEDGDLIQIGDYDLAVQREAAQPSAPTARVPASALQAAIAQAESAAAAAAAAQGDPDEARGEGEGEEDFEEETPAVPAEEVTSVMAGRQRRQSTAVIRLDQIEMNRPRRLEAVEVDAAPRLVVVSPEFRGQEFSCIRTEMRVGRTEDNDIAIDHRSLSRLHAKVVREDTGEWRIIDMQSANGMSVNGEIYAQASLSHGDLVELGHVKLRFIGPGASTAGLMHDGKKGSRRGLMMAMAGLVLLGAVGGAAWFLFGQESAPVTPEPPLMAQPPDKPADTLPPATAQTPPPATAQTPPPTTAPEPTPEDVLNKAQAAVKTLDFDTAVSLLGAMGTRSPEAETLLQRAQAEQATKKGLDAARQEFQGNKFAEAQKQLAALPADSAFAPEINELKKKVDAALKPPDKPTNTARPVVSTAPERPDPAAEVQQLATDAHKMLTNRQFRESEFYLKKCIALDPANVQCHLLMGVACANLNRPDEAAQAYRKVLELSPNHPNAPKLRTIISDYEKSQKTKGGK